MSPLHRSWLADEADEARRTITAHELRPVGQVPCVPTSTGVLIGCAYRRPMPQPSADAERIQAALLAKPARRASDGWAFWLTLLACVLVFVLMSGCTGPSDTEADADSALNLQDAIAQAQAERTDLWTPETIERAKTAALIAAVGRK
jgi:hypothetical protein